MKTHSENYYFKKKGRTTEGLSPQQSGYSISADIDVIDLNYRLNLELERI